ncbi:MAG: YihY/virulence factor BrkB family protein [Clostridium sp.]|nr:YihY/virulence factor BrkB family protein [Prevotella sp.]MCM1429450.1 YihY/virulence factor BrkB family protein [Clostridium sp.]MCM1475515.1 YihY/virulence factor BrkB family protein [Muribaculaceae bacterium]
MSLSEKISALYQKAYDFGMYCWSGVWRDPKNTWKTKIIKTLNLSIHSFLDRDLQMKASALVYYTVLAIVPAFALLFAISRGFGFQDNIEAELYQYFPGQIQAIKAAMSFVDSYLKASGQGIFVGIGIVMLLWTLVSLLSTIEDTFNATWDIKQSRSMYQKVTDYIAICLIIPVLMVCSSGVSIFMSTIVQNNLQLQFLSPMVNLSLECIPLVLVWLAFSLSFYLIPNTKVLFKYAAISGGMCAIGYMIVQLLFVNGQIYVTKFNAIYGSFAFLPLLLVWLQLSYLILLFGCVMTYSMQNVFVFNFMGDIKEVSHDYMRKVALVLVAAITDRFVNHEEPMTRTTLSRTYDLPIRLVSRIEDRLTQAGLIYHVILKERRQGLVPAFETSTFTVKELFDALDKVGSDDFIPRFNEKYTALVYKVNMWNSEAWNSAGGTLIKDMEIGNKKS